MSNGHRRQHPNGCQVRRLFPLQTCRDVFTDIALWLISVSRDCGLVSQSATVYLPTFVQGRHRFTRSPPLGRYPSTTEPIIVLSRLPSKVTRRQLILESNGHLSTTRPSSLTSTRFDPRIPPRISMVNKTMSHTSTRSPLLGKCSGGW